MAGRGRPKGYPKSGGKKKGSKNKRTLELEKRLADPDILMPLDYMHNVMRDEKADPRRRDDMAKAAAVYDHPRPAALLHLSGQIKVVRLKVPDLNE